MKGFIEFLKEANPGRIKGDAQRTREARKGPKYKEGHDRGTEAHSLGFKSGLIHDKEAFGQWKKHGFSTPEGTSYSQGHSDGWQNANLNRSVKEDAVEPLLGEGGKGKAKFKLHFLHVKKKNLPVKAMTGKKSDRESGPDTPIQLNKGVPNRFQNIGQDVAMNI